MGQKRGFWKVSLSFPIPRWKKSGFASVFSSFSPSGVQTCPREGEEQLRAHLSARAEGRAKILWQSQGEQLCLWIGSSVGASG